MNKEIEEAIGRLVLYKEYTQLAKGRNCIVNKIDLELVLNYIKELEENKNVKDTDLMDVYLKGVYDGKEQAIIDNSICKEKMVEDALQENVKLKKQLVDSTPNSVIREKIEELENSQKRVKNNNLIYSREDVFRFQIYVLEEILKEGEK